MVMSSKLVYNNVFIGLNYFHLLHVNMVSCVVIPAISVELHFNILILLHGGSLLSGTEIQ